MAFVLSLISNPAAPALDASAVTVAHSLAREYGAGPGEAKVLKPDVAVEVPLASDGGDLIHALRDAFVNRPLDLAITPAENRRKRLFLADMDSTMIQVECIDEIADVLGIKDQVAEITERSMRGELEFEASLRERVALLNGLPAASLKAVYEERILFSPGAMTAVRTMAAAGTRTVLVSGGFTFFTERVGAALGFHAGFANTLLFEGEALSGAVAEPVLGREAKLERLRAEREALGLTIADSLCVGDGANDLAMLGEAGLGVAYRAKPVVAEQAHVRLDHADLTGLLYLQGYTDDEFVAG